MSSWLLFFFQDLFIFITKSDIQRGGKTKRKIFRPMIQSPSERNGRCCANLKPGAKNLLWVSHAGAGSQSFGMSSTGFPMPQARSWMGSGAAGTRTGAHMGS